MNLADKKAEAVSRLKLFGVESSVVTAFEERDFVHVSDIYGIPRAPNGEQIKLIEVFEKQYDAVVYLVVHSITPFGTMDSLLCVMDNVQEWPAEVADIKDRYPLTYTYNYQYPDFSEFGFIEVSPQLGGLIRKS